MSRLTRRTKDHLGREYIAVDTHRVYKYKPYYEAIEKLAHYEDLEEQGRLIELPFPIDTEEVFFADENDCEVYVLDYHLHVIYENDEMVYYIDGFNFTKEEASALLFATEEEAEAKLAELGGKA